MQQLAQICEAVAATTKKTEKVALVAEYFRARPPGEAAQGAVFLSGRAFPAWDERNLQVGGALLWRTIAEVSGKSDLALRAAYRRYGDMGSAAVDVLEDAPATSTLSLAEVAATFDRLAQASGAAQKSQVLRDLLGRATSLEAKYIIKVIGGDLRIGLRESLVEEAIAKAFDVKPAEVQRANMLLGDIAETLRLAQAGELGRANMRLFHPLGFMLASPATNSEAAFSYFAHAAVEDKYDGVRAQAHCGGKTDSTIRLFSRTLDEISPSFPELRHALRAFAEPLVLDGEILAWSESTGQALPFSSLQQRLGRKGVSEEMIRDIPVVYVVFDVLYAAGELTIDRPLEERRKILEGIFASIPDGTFCVAPEVASGNLQDRLVFEAPALESNVAAARSSARNSLSHVILAPMLTADSSEHLDGIFSQARDRGNEGLMVKDLHSPYTPGRRGKSWLKLKRELATLDVVVTAVEWGHGKRARVLSDYTFAVREGDQLLNVGKAYSGLTDAEIAEMTRWFLDHTIEDQGFRRLVEPAIVLEVAFNNMMRSDRHESGFALRFPRIVRIRTDKDVEEIDTLATVREIYAQQGAAGQRSSTEFPG
jgi:DNA ligase-1